MSTLSVPLPNELEQAIENLISSGVVSNKAEFARKAMTAYLEDLAVEGVLKARQEPNLEGDLDELAKRL